MCGIIGYNGKEKKALQVLIHGLKILEYRGYDSAGVAVINNNKLHITKTIGKIKNCILTFNNEEVMKTE